jgi:superfamily II DNA or RNA helicase
MENYEKVLKEIILTRKLDYRPIYGSTILDKIYPEKPHVIAAATSFGKTYLIAAKFELYYKLGIIKPNEKVLILASYQTILRDNFANQFEQFGVTSFTYAIVENKNDLENAIKDKIQVIITIPQTIEKHANKIKKVKWLVVDEAHNWYFAPTIDNIISVIKPKYRLLLTGTPFKFNLRKDEFIIDYVSVKELYDSKLISDVQLKVLHSSVELHQLDYVKILGHLKESKKIVKGDLVDSLNQVIKQLIKILGLVNKNWDNINNISKNYISVFNKMEKSIIYTNGKHECDCIYEFLKLNKVSALKSHSSDGQDAVETFRLFKEDNSIKVLIVVNRGKEGFNFPELYNIIDFSYTQDFATTMQMIGRLLRLSENKIQKVFYKVAPKNTSLYFMDWMNYLIQLFDNEWYERYTGRNAREIRVPNPLLSSNQTTERTPRERTETTPTFNPRNLNDTGMLSLKFMDDNKWFKSSDYLSVVGSTSLGEIISKFTGKSYQNMWTDTEIKNELEKYNFNSYNDLKKQNPKLAYAANRRGFLDNVKTHKNYLSKEIIIEAQKNEVYNNKIAEKLGLDFQTYKRQSIFYGIYRPNDITKMNKLKTSKIIICLDKITKEIIKEYESAAEAGRQLNISRGSINSAANGKIPSAAGFLWKYKEIS